MKSFGYGFWKKYTSLVSYGNLVLPRSYFNHAKNTNIEIIAGLLL